MSYTPPTIKTAVLPATGVTAAMSHMLWLAVVLFILGGMLVALSKVGPRLAIEPVRTANGKRRFRLTKNGRPVTRR